jgi:hypothetical protein
MAEVLECVSKVKMHVAEEWLNSEVKTACLCLLISACVFTHSHVSVTYSSVVQTNLLTLHPQDFLFNTLLYIFLALVLRECFTFTVILYYISIRN